MQYLNLKLLKSTVNIIYIRDFTNLMHWIEDTDQEAYEDWIELIGGEKLE